jgi:class 3 adenylate cyclase/tetratricopeptide (TPR) repeat protein
MAVCASCGQENPEIARFCLACGTSLEAQAAPVEEERKPVTAVFTDLVGSTARAEHLDPEDVRAMLGRYYSRLRYELEQHGGSVEKFIGDAVVAVFGAPAAHEDDPERAVRAALAIQQAIDELNEDDAWLDLHVRIGVNTGEALVLLSHKAAEGEGFASGDVMNTAARLEANAPVNGILVGEETYRLTAHAIEYREAEPIVAKGKSEPVRAWEALGLKDEPVRPGRVDSPLVGRSADVQRLVDHWQRVRSERRRLVTTIVGPPGIGKSRLVQEVAAHAQKDGAGVHVGRCLSYGEGITYWPLTEVVKSAAGILQSDRPDTVAEKLGGFIDALPTSNLDELRTIAAAFSNLLGVRSTPRGTYSAADISRSELHWGIRRGLELVAAERPLVVVLEDLHWADAALLDLVRFIADGDNGSSVPLLIVATARPELLETDHPLTHGDGYRALIAIDALDEAESRALLAELAGGTELPRAMAETLVRNAGGNPLFLEQMMGMLNDQGLLEGDVEELDAIPVPTSIQSLIGSRLDQLPAQQKRVAHYASVMGQVFWTGALQDLLEANGSVDEALAELERRDVVRRRRESAVAGEDEYAFKHALIRDVAYGRLPKGRRASLHVRHADWIQSMPAGEEEFVEFVAYHLEQACRLAREVARSPVEPPIVRAVTELSRAAERAERREGMHEAHRYYERAIALLDDDRGEIALELRLRSARTLTGLGDLRTGVEQLREIATEAERLERPDLHCAALLGLGNVELRQGRAEAGAHLALADELAGRVGDYGLRVRAAFARAALKSELEGEFDDAAVALRRAIGIAEEMDDTALAVEGRLRLGFLLYNKGDLSGSADQLARCTELAAALGSRRDEARAAFQLSLVRYYRGDLDGAERIAAQARAWLERTGETFFQIQNLIALAIFALARDDSRLAEERLQEALPPAVEEGGWLAIEIYRLLAEALVRQGRVADAAELVAFAARGVPEEYPYARAAILLARGTVAAARGDADLTGRSYDEALAVLEPTNLPLDLAQARLAYARALRALGDNRGAWVQLDAARMLCVGLGADGLLAEIDRELETRAGGAGSAGPARGS